LSVVLAGGGTAGHVEPAMAVADALDTMAPEELQRCAGTQFDPAVVEVFLATRSVLLTR